jgi:WD40 repeat protein
LAWDDGSIHLFELETLNQVGDFAGHKSHVPGVAFTPDGSTLASVDDDAMLVVWSVADQTPISVVTPAEADVGAVTLAADGATAMVGLGDATVRLWNLRTGEAGPVLEGHTSAVTSVATTSDARLALSASDDGTIRVWDLRAASQLRVLKGHAAGVTGVAFGPDAETAISASSDGTVRVWDVETGKQLRYLARSPKRPITMTLHSNHGTQLDFTVPSLGITGVAVATSGLVAATNWDDKTLLLWDLGDERAHSPPPAVSREAVEPYREFESLYASVGMRVLRDGPNQGDIEVW